MLRLLKMFKGLAFPQEIDDRVWKRQGIKDVPGQTQFDISGPSSILNFRQLGMSWFCLQTVASCWRGHCGSWCLF